MSDIGKKVLDRAIGILDAVRQRALIERPRSFEVAQVLKQQGEIVEARRCIGMLGTKRPLADRHVQYDAQDVHFPSRSGFGFSRAKTKSIAC